MIELFKLLHSERKGDFMANKTNDMAHTKWMCKYYIVFAMVFSITHCCVNFIKASCYSI